MVTWIVILYERREAPRDKNDHVGSPIPIEIDGCARFIPSGENSASHSGDVVLCCDRQELFTNLQLYNNSPNNI